MQRPLALQTSDETALEHPLASSPAIHHFSLGWQTGLQNRVTKLGGKGGSDGRWDDETRWIRPRGNFYQKGQMVNAVSGDFCNVLTSFLDGDRLSHGL
jgi:hypothetical protein